MVSKAEDFRLILLGKEITPVASAQEVPFFSGFQPKIQQSRSALTVSSCMARLGKINRVKQGFGTNTYNHHNQCFVVFSKLYHCCNVSGRHLGAQSECYPSLHRTLYFLSISCMGAIITHNIPFYAWISRTSFQTEEDWTVTNTMWCDQTLKLYKLSLVPVRKKAPMKNLPGSQIDCRVEMEKKRIS